MRHFFISLFLFFSVSSTVAQNYREYFAMAEKAYQIGKFTLFQQYLVEANKLRPNHQTIMYELAKAFALNDQLDSSCYYLESVIAIDAIHYDISDADLSKLKGTPYFERIVKKQQFLIQPILAADTVLSIKDPSLHIEDVAFDHLNQQFLLSSINKRNIYSLRPSGEIVAILSEQLAVSPTGIALDQAGYLWAAAMGIPEGGLNPESEFLNKSFLYKIDLKKGKIDQKFEIKDALPHLFGDVFISSEDRIFVSDSKQNEIYELVNNELKPLLQTNELISLQGLTKVGNHLILADYVKGLFIFNLQTGQLQQIENPYSIALKGIDGLYADHNNLVAIQNGVAPNRIISLNLTEDLKAIVAYEYLEKNHPAFGEPTLGYLENQELVFVANSFWGKYKNGIIDNPKEELVTILKLSISSEN